MECPFCVKISAGSLPLENEFAVAFPDAFPVSPGHTLVIPRRHEPDFFALPSEDQAAVLSLVNESQQAIARLSQPHGFNIGINVGAAAGQTVFHAHVHVIPRYLGDVADPRGGVRGVLPHKANYWEK